MTKVIKRYIERLYSFFFTEISFKRSKDNKFIYYDNDFVETNFKKNKSKITILKVFEKDGFLLKEPQINPIIFFALSQFHKKKINVLDYGGGTGSLFFNNKLFFNKNIKWDIFETKRIHDLLKNANFKINSYHNVSDLLDKQYDIVIFSSSLQYIENYSDILNLVIKNTVPNIILVLKTPFIKLNKDILAIQHNKQLKSNYSSLLFSFNKFNKTFDKFGYSRVYNMISNETSKYHFYNTTKVDFRDLIFKKSI
jgi:putative methyltransferase (TIGR04325 family)